MQNRHKWTLAFSLGLVVYAAAQNLDTTTTVRRMSSGAVEGMKGVSIPAAYLASLPEVQDNGGQIPDAIAKADVTPYVVEVHRGWPSCFQNEHGYRYEIVNPTAGYSSTLSGFPKPHGIVLSRLAFNIVGIIAIALILPAMFITGQRLAGAALASTQDEPAKHRQ